jgi:pyruvate, water dikinase
MAVMQNRLNIVGYLTMHTRQLDMVMSREGMVDHYRQKIKADIQRLFKPPGYPDTDNSDHTHYQPQG